MLLSGFTKQDMRDMHAIFPNARYARQAKRKRLICSYANRLKRESINAMWLAFLALGVPLVSLAMLHLLGERLAHTMALALIP